MPNKKDVNEFFRDEDDFDSEEIDLALRQLIAKGLVELHFDGDEFCFSVTEKGKDLSDKIKDKED